MENEAHQHGSFKLSTIARNSGNKRSVVGPVELFFDLVYVFAIIQISHLLVGHLSWLGFFQTTIIFAAIWWGWNYTAWAMNWLNPSNGIVQLFTTVLMFLALGMAVSIPHAFTSTGLLFAICYVLMGLLRPIFMVLAFRGRTLAHNYRLLGAWSATAGVFWIVGAFLEGEWRLLIWAVAVILDYAAPRIDYKFPVLGSAPMKDWDTDAEHLSERNRLVFIIALGESILLMGNALLSQNNSSFTLIASLIVGFACLAALWFNYFALTDEDTGGDSNTTALRSAYAYAHALMVGGAILIAVSIELRLSHSHLTPAMVLITIGGPITYLIGNILFLRSRLGQMAQSRFIAIGILLIIGVLATVWLESIPILSLSIVIFLVIGGLAVVTAVSRNFKPNRK